MNQLRRFTLNQSEVVNERFCEKVLSKFFNDYYLYVWSNRKGFSSFQGNEISLFIVNVQIITEFVDRTFIPNEQTNEIKEILILWYDLFKFLGLTYLVGEYEKNRHEVQIKECEKSQKNISNRSEIIFITTG